MAWPGKRGEGPGPEMQSGAEQGTVTLRREDSGVREVVEAALKWPVVRVAILTCSRGQSVERGVMRIQGRPSGVERLA